jgi:hypothetical protein
MVSNSPIKNTSFEKAIRLFRRHSGVLRTSEAIRFGIHPRALYAMRDAGVLECLSRGLYRLADLPPLSNPDLVAAALKTPTGVICLISAPSRVLLLSVRGFKGHGKHQALGAKAPVDNLVKVGTSPSIRPKFSCIVTAWLTNLLK